VYGFIVMRLWGEVLCGREMGFLEKKRREKVSVRDVDSINVLKNGLKLRIF